VTLYHAVRNKSPLLELLSCVCLAYVCATMPYNVNNAFIMLIGLLQLSCHMNTQKDEGIVTIPSTHSVDQTVDRFETILQSKGVKLFALVDHSGEAAKVGLKMPPTKLLIFGKPKAGTPLMLAIALDLPLKILVAQDSRGKVWISYNSHEYLKERYGLSQDLLPNIAVVEKLAAAGE
jgi:uncharacterized protein (DUF302 family)